MTDNAEVPARRRQAGRSPSYPAIGLRRAVDRVRQLYRADRQFPVPVDAVVKTWGYTTLNGPAGLQLAALKKYGLLLDEGAKDDRRVRVTDLAVRILEHPDPAEREAALREAALKPSSIQQLWLMYGGELPSNSTLLWMLTKELNFTESGAREFIRVYRETVETLSHDGDAEAEAPTVSRVSYSLEPTSEMGQGRSPAESEAIFTSATSAREVLAAAEDPAPAQPTVRSAGARGLEPSALGSSYAIPVGYGRHVTMHGEFPLSEPEWALLMTVLEAMKPALVTT